MLMGIYLFIIAVEDARFRDNYTNRIIIPTGSKYVDVFMILHYCKSIGNDIIRGICIKNRMTRRLE